MSAIPGLRVFPATAALLILAGCATPQPVLDLAGQGAATVGLAEVSLRDYLTITQGQLAARMDLLRIEAQQELRDRTRREFDVFVSRQAGEPADDSANVIRVLGDEHRRLREKEAVELDAIARRFSLDASGMAQVPAEKFGAAKKSFGVLAEELSPREWFELAVVYAREIRTGVEQLRESVQDAGKAGQ